MLNGKLSGRRSKMQPVKFHIFDDADDFTPRVGAVISDPFAERCFIRPKAAGQRFVDKEHARRPGCIAHGKHASFEQLRTYRASN
jgi:hypothetical protein